MKTNMSRIPHCMLCLYILVMGSAACAQVGYQVPRTSDGQPDIQGVWANNTVTPVQRPDICLLYTSDAADDLLEGREFLSAEEMQIISQRAGEITAGTDDALFGESVITSALSGDTGSNDPSTGNYDQFWLAERSIHNRTSQIIDPSNGKYPPLTEELSLIHI